VTVATKQRTSARNAALAQRLRVVRNRLERRLSLLLHDFFRAQAERVVSRYLDHAKIAMVNVDTLLPPSEDALLEIVFRGPVSQASLLSGNFAAMLVGAEPLTEADPAVLRRLAESAQRVTNINNATRQAIQQTLNDATLSGYGAYQTVNGVPADGFAGLRSVVQETYQGRADTIARTEMATVSQQAAHERYDAAGVQEVDIIDGPECGWTAHDDPDLADGSRRTLDEADEYPTAHPNCGRVSLPVVA
jgi:hypothetical protein